MNDMSGKIMEVSLINQHGDKLTLILDDNKNIWFHHDDCNTKYERITKAANYVFNELETVVIAQFILECKKYD